MTHKTSLVPILLIFSMQASAFINIESMRQQETPGLSGSSALQFSGQSGSNLFERHLRHKS